MTTGDAREKLEQALNIDPQATIQVNGKAVDDSHRLAEGERLEFVKEARHKG